MRRALVLGCVAGILLAGCGQDEPELLAESTASEDVGGGAAGSTEVCPESSDSRGSPAIASFGDGDLIVFAGAAAGCVFADGFVVSPDGERRPLPTSPFERPPLGPTAVVADESMFVVGCEQYINEICDPSDVIAAELRGDTWAAIDVPDDLLAGAVGVHAVGALGDSLVALEMRGEKGGFLTFSLVDRTWLAVPQPPLAIAAACTTGTRIVASGVLPREATDVPETLGPEATAAPGTADPPTLMVYDMAKESEPWAVLSVADAAGFAGSFHSLVCAGEHAILTAYNDVAGAVRFDLDAMAGSTVPEPPRTDSFSARVWTGADVVFVPSLAGERTLMLDPVNATWREGDATSDPGPAAVVWTGTRVAGVSTPTSFSDGRVVWF